jgi:hypothetical protein
MPGPNLPKVFDAAYIAGTLSLEAEISSGLLRTGCLTPAMQASWRKSWGGFAWKRPRR